ncbi:MAG TPA: GNAT family N-acetyltransferase [Candidatus Polarisedimenticolia bacterium]|jgi:hypothetical protein
MNRLDLVARPWSSLDDGSRSAYARLVQSCPWSTVFHTPEWLDVLEDSFSPRASCLMAASGARVVGAFPFFTLPGPAPGHTNHSCLRDRDMVYGGPIASMTFLQGVDEGSVLHAMMDRFEAGPRTMASFVLPPPGFPDEVLQERGYRMTRHLTATVDIARPAESIWAGVHSKTRNMISKARRCGLTVREATEEDLLDLPAMIAAPFLLAGKRPPDPVYLLNVARRLRQAGLARILVATGGSGGSIAGAIFLRHRDRSYYWAGGALDEGYETAASHLVQWEGIDAARADGCVEHDLVMINPVAAPGIARFKLRFGARVVPLWTASRRAMAGRILGRTLRMAGRLASALAGPAAQEDRGDAIERSPAPVGPRPPADARRS